MDEERITPFLSSTILASAALDTTIYAELAFDFTVLKSSISNLPSFLTTTDESTSDLDAVPPT
jgi:hypothetical protein